MEPTSLDTRKPVIDPEQAEAFLNSAVEKQWRLITEAIRRDCLSVSAVRDALKRVCTEPVSEDLPYHILQELAAIDPRIAQLCERYGQDQLLGYLTLPPVPDEQIVPDISNAPTLPDPITTTKRLRDAYQNRDVEYERELQSMSHDGYFRTGITAEERLLVARRCRFARDLKMLALGAELLQTNEIQSSESKSIELPSGVRIALDASSDEQHQDLLQPHLWEKRRQLKDRVYEIAVNNRKYILKEKKTARHTDTKRGGHRDGLTSVEELAAAQHFSTLGPIEGDQISVRWEKPVGCATYPDGFSFAVFEHEPGLVSDDQITRQLAREIEEHRAEFETEYQAVYALAEQYKNSPKVLAVENGSSESALYKMLRWLKLSQPKPEPTLTFEEFARVKAFRLGSQARERMATIALAEGYANNDHDGFAFKVKRQPKVQLEIIGFDFEYYSKMSPDEQVKRMTRHLDYSKEGMEVERQHGLGFLGWSHAGSVTRMEKAAYFALLELESRAEQDQPAQTDL